jgi:organic radical activating enzyme
MKIAKLNDGPEIFYTIQGEGKNLGRPSIFVRSSLCNLHCIWCDTDYTWNWEGTRFAHVKDADPAYKKFRMEDQIVEMEVSEIAEEVMKYPCKNLVLTGGEPMMQQEDWVKLMEILRSRDENYFFEVETNGTKLPTPAFDKYIDQYNVSPKLANSGNKKSLREKADVYAYFAEKQKAVFKFVQTKEADLEETLALIQQFHIPPHRVYMMPEGTSPASLQAKQQWLVEICKQHGFNYTDRLHVHIYGAKRGV